MVSALRRVNVEIDESAKILRDLGLRAEAMALLEPGLVEWAKAHASRVITAEDLDYPKPWRDRLGFSAPASVWTNFRMDSEREGSLAGPKSSANRPQWNGRALYLAVVGSRVVDAEFEAWSHALVAEAKDAGFGIVSGGAPGIDRIAVPVSPGANPSDDCRWGEERSPTKLSAVERSPLRGSATSPGGQRAAPRFSDVYERCNGSEMQKDSGLNNDPVASRSKVSRGSGSATDLFQTPAPTSRSCANLAPPDVVILPCGLQRANEFFAWGSEGACGPPFAATFRPRPAHPSAEADPLRVLQLSVCAPFEAFSRAVAMERNVLVYAFGEATVVVHARLREGGTWHGAVHALKRKLRVIVYDHPKSPGAKALISLGAVPIRSPDQLREALDSPGPQPWLLAAG